ncbi:S-adenosyl-L-methionine-dependent methyltransferase [Glomus cerebriforme]|uniref:S-adenosyl-L-methionine-dependent methyltransferase n=1 Tax=Glomus cerebriforme TaxID=658196 RepID=A0A397SUL7_9GLOM|nr:S-adenosyl-L-methionine-dependent methyltransferase [Glomus cerebriforme]
MKDEQPNQEFDSSDPLKSDNTESILDSFRFVNGRRYHNLDDVTYLLPNDNKEAKRLYLQHNLFKFAWQNNYSSPIHEFLKSGKAKVLDIGCGSGHWILDMAREYPQATFVGIDMSPLFPDAKNTPSNVLFLQHNLNNGIPFPNETFDFVFQRFLCNNVVLDKWKIYVKEMIRVTKSGGWLEFFEFELNYDRASAFHLQVLELVHSAFEAKGIISKPESVIPPFLETCQELSEVHFKEVSIPIGHWAGQLGTMMLTYTLMNAETIRLLITSAWGVDDKTFDWIFENSNREFDENKLHTKSFRWFSKKI